MAIADTSAQDVLLNPKSRGRRTLIVVVVEAIVLGIGGWFTIPALKRWSEAEASVTRERLRLATV